MLIVCDKLLMTLALFPFNHIIIFHFAYFVLLCHFLIFFAILFLYFYKLLVIFLKILILDFERREAYIYLIMMWFIFVPV